CAASRGHAADAAGRYHPFPSPLSASSSCAGSGKPFSAETACLLPGAPRHPVPRHQCCPLHLDLAGALVRLAPGVSHCAASDLSPLASSGVWPVLALEIQIWTLADPSRPASPYPADGQGESDVGPGAHCE